MYLATSDFHRNRWQLLHPGTDVLDDGNGCYFNDQYTAEVLRETLLDPNTGFRYKRPVVCGPYQLKNVDIGSETVELEINKEYLGRYDGTKPHVETIISKPIATETWRDEFEKGTVDYFYSSKGETIDSTLTKVEDGEIKANYGIVPQDSVNEFRFACDSEQASSRKYAVLLLTLLTVMK